MNKTILVNKDNKIKDSYFKNLELVKAKDIDNNDVLVEKETYKAFKNLQKFFKIMDIDVGIDGAYRSIEEQKLIYKKFEKTYGKEYTERIVAEPYTSEHHTGLAIDIAIKVDGKYPKDNNELESQISYYENIHKYLKDFGFILRYPKGKENITNYPYEAWHIRYVGPIVAHIVYKNNWTLEEYLTNFSGLLVINKERDMTSFDVVNKISKIFGIKRVGHTGTLDPLAEGVLIVAIGKATKVVELITASYKEYIAEVKLGIRTDTRDITGKVINKKKFNNKNNLEEVINSFKKTYMQEVPIYSAVKVNGKKLYEYARNKEEITLPKKEVTIKEIELLESKSDTFKFRALVSKGCYIRSLIDDIGISLNTYATMTSLKRTKQGNIKLEDAYTLSDLQNNNYKIYEIDELLDYKVIKADEDLAHKLKNGQTIKNNFNIEDRVIFKDNDNKLIGIYEKSGDNLKVWKNFFVE